MIRGTSRRDICGYISIKIATTNRNCPASLVTSFDAHRMDVEAKLMHSIRSRQTKPRAGMLKDCRRSTCDSSGATNIDNCRCTSRVSCIGYVSNVAIRRP